MKRFVLAWSIFFTILPLIGQTYLESILTPHEYGCVICSDFYPCRSQKSNEYSPLAYLPIQEKLLVTENREERLLLKIKAEMDISEVKGTIVYEIGNVIPQLINKPISFDKVKTSNAIEEYISSPFELKYEEWLTSYVITSVKLILNYTDINRIQSSEIFNLNYININASFLNSIPYPDLVPLLEDSTIVHLGNSLYVQYEKVIKNQINQDGHFLDDDHENPFQLETILDSIYGEAFFADYDLREKGLDDKLSTVFGFPLVPITGNRFNAPGKTGIVGFSVLLNSTTFNHEMLHQYFPWFTAETVTKELDIDVQSHHHVIFTGQTGFGSAPASRLPIGYPVLCRENLEDIDTINNKLSITITEECNPNFVFEVEDLYQGVHSAYELYIMGLTDHSEIDFPFFYGSEFEESYTDLNESVTWSFQELKSIDEDVFTGLHSEWYDEKNDQFPGFFDAREKNMLFMFFGTHNPSPDEYKVLSFISDELTNSELSIEIPQYRKEGNFQYNRYLSYNQSTLGLGALTNNFPLPPGYTTTSTNDLENSSNFSFYPNPTYDQISLKTAVERIEVINLSGQRLISKENVKEIDVSALVSGVYPTQVWFNGGVVTQKLVKI